MSVPGQLPEIEDLRNDVRTAADLTGHSRAWLEKVYRAARQSGLRRSKCSRDDFTAGYVAGLLSMGHDEAFVQYLFVEDSPEAVG